MPNDPNELQGEERQELERWLDENESGLEIEDKWVDEINQLATEAAQDDRRQNQNTW